MNKQTLKALKGSIKKWERIVAGELEDEGPDNCPLCKLYYWDKDCTGCPVFEKTAKHYCSGTPYEDKWVPLIRREAFVNKRADTPEKKKAARAELKFLKSLLP